MTDDNFDYSQLPLEQVQALAAGQAPAQQPSAFDNVANAAGSIATTASQGLLQGTRNFQVGGGLLLRDITDALGMTSKQSSDAIRRVNAQDNATTDAAAQQAGNPMTGAISKYAGEVLPNIAVSGGAGSLLSGNVAKGLVGGVVGGALPDAGDLVGRAENAAIGGLLGAGLAKAGEYIAGKTKLVTDAEKEGYFKTLGITPRASQVAADPQVANSYSWIEGKLSKLPLGDMGSPGSVAKQIKSYTNNVPKVINELDNTLEGPSSRVLFQTAVDNPTVAARYSDLSNLKTSAQKLSNDLATHGNQISDFTKNTLQNTIDSTPLNMGGLQGLRSQVNDHINDLYKANAPQAEIKAMSQFRNYLSDHLQELAQKNGVLKEWNAANARWKQENVVQRIQAALSKSYEAGGSAENGDPLLPTMLRKNINTAMKSLQDDNFVPTGQLKDTITGIQRVSAQLFSKGAPKVANANAPLSQATAVKGTLATAGAWLSSHVLGGPLTAALAGAGYTVAKGMQMMLSSDTGLKLLAAAGRSSAPSALRQAAVTAFAIGHAGILQEASKINDQQDSFDYSTLSPEQLDAIANGQNPNQGQQ